MKDFTPCSAAISLLMTALIVWNTPHISALSVEETCKIVTDNTFIADPTDCEGWVQCINGQPNYGRCKNGLFFDVISGNCDYPEHVECIRNTTTMCRGLTGVYKPDPNNCQNYCYCNNGNPHWTSCPHGQQFDRFGLRCIYSSNELCSANSCYLAPNDFVKDINSCAGWLRCGYGEVVAKGTCEPGLYYNAKEGLCDYKQNVECKWDIGFDVPKAPVAPQNICATTDRFGGFVADGATCRGYFACQSPDDVTPSWGQCPRGSHFNPVTLTCTDPYLVRCPYNRCEGVAKMFMTELYSQCSSYYVCNNGVVSAKGMCPSNFPYFNEESQACQTDSIDYPICEN